MTGPDNASQDPIPKERRTRLARRIITWAQVILALAQVVAEVLRFFA